MKGNTFDRERELRAAAAMYSVLQKHAAGLRELFIVSQVKLSRVEFPKGIAYCRPNNLPIK